MKGDGGIGKHIGDKQCFLIIKYLLFGVLAQLARASALHAEGHQFESDTLHQIKFGLLAQLARAPALHAGGHRFESDTVHKLLLK